MRRFSCLGWCSGTYSLCNNTSGFSGDVEAVLDNLAFELSSNSRARGYIVAYAGKESRRGEAKEMADKARQYLINRRAIASDRIIARDGGFREMAQYDLFSLSTEMSPPTPTPTVPSNKVQIVKPGTRAKRRPPKLSTAYENGGEDQIKYVEVIDNQSRNSRSRGATCLWIS
jgi:hypothetical protein